MNALPRPDPSRPSLRLIGIDDEPSASTDFFSHDGDPSPYWTLSELFEQHLLPHVLVEAKPGTIKEYRSTLRYWGRATGDPPLLQIDGESGRQFQRWLKEECLYRGAPLADNTRRKHCVQLQFLLDQAGPRERDDEWDSLFGYRCRRCKPRVIVAEPRCCPQCGGTTVERKPPRIDKPGLVINQVEDNFELAEIAQWLDVCHLARTPCKIVGVAAPLWWHSLVLVVYNTGLRIGTVVQLQWDWLYQDELGWWLKIPGRAIKKKRGRPFFVTPAALAALHRIQPLDASQERSRIFPWPHKQAWLHDRRRELLAATEIQPSRRFGFHGLRKALNTELQKINPTAARMALGHSGRDVNIDHYTHRKVMVEAMLKMPQPAPRREPPPREIQRILF